LVEAEIEHENLPDTIRVKINKILKPFLLYKNMTGLSEVKSRKKQRLECIATKRNNYI